MVSKRHYLWVISCVLLAASGCNEDANQETALICESGLEICGQSCCAYTCIDNKCVDTSSDTTHCGEPGNTCSNTQICYNGNCMAPEEACEKDQEFCKGDCVNIMADVNNCGTCGNICKENESCQDGSCVVGCALGYTLCDGVCVNTRIDSEHCGGCGEENVCSGNQLCHNGKCSCPSGYYDCDGDPSNGCESATLCDYVCDTGEKVCGPGLCCGLNESCCGSGCCPENTMCCGEGVCADVINDAHNCGACGIACEAHEKCENGACIDNSNATCDPDPETGEIAAGDIVCWGECVHSLTDSANCGACGNACDEGYACDAGQCVKQCDAADETACGDTCFNLNTDAQNCGACGNVCGTTQVCAEGVCTDSEIVCEDAAQTLCWGVCKDLQNDVANCGACGNVCDEGLSCVDGTCKLVCAKETEMVCNGGCVDVVSNPKACSDCGISCATTQICVEGGCVDPETPVECTETQTNCWNTCTDLKTDTANCGACGTVCGENQTCTDGVCTDIPEESDPNACDAPNLVCYGICTDVMNDDKNCGACLNACNAGEKCQNGVCELQCGELEKCGAACVDTHISSNHCGSCGVACKDGESCIGGDCQCTEGRYDCDGIASNGCESTQVCTCTPGSKQPCWLGKSDNRNQGACKDGTQVCDNSGQFWGQCTGGTYPSAITCNDAGLYIGGDQNCNGVADTTEECVTSCDLRLTDSSYIGCEYWAAYTENYSTGGYFSVILSNMNDEDANVTIYYGSNSKVFKTLTLEKGTVESVTLSDHNYDNIMLKNTILKKAGIRIVSTQPITAYQFNPIRTSALYNDALLLLPKNVYGKEYYNIIGSTTNEGSHTNRTYIAVQASSPGKTTITVKPNIDTMAGAGYGSYTSISAMTANKTYTYTLEQYDVFQITAKGSTIGTSITSDKPIIAIAGCPACYNAVNMNSSSSYSRIDIQDHYSEQLFPYQSWGKNYAFAGYEKQGSEHDQYRIISPKATTLTITPAITDAKKGTIGGSTKINIKANEPYDIVTKNQFKLSSTEPILVAGFLGDEGTRKDPSYSLMVPVEQFRTDYSFLIPANYSANHITIIAPSDIVSVKLYEITSSGETLKQTFTNSSFTKIGTIGWAYKYYNIGTTSKTYKLVADKPIGVQSYGYTGSSSYAYPLGLNLTRLNNTN